MNFQTIGSQCGILDSRLIPKHVSVKTSLQRLATSLDKPKAQVQTDDWVFIKIGFSYHPATPIPGKVSKKQDTVIYPKHQEVMLQVLE